MLSGVDVVLDGAHALGQIEFDLPALGVAFAGYNLHKWIGGPLTLGFMYIDPRRLADIAPDMGNQRYPEPDIRTRAPYGTVEYCGMADAAQGAARAQGIGWRQGQRRAPELPARAMGE